MSMITLHAGMPLVPSGQARPVVTLATILTMHLRLAHSGEPGQQLKRATQEVALPQPVHCAGVMSEARTSV